jgi:cysteine synthase A
MQVAQSFADAIGNTPLIRLASLSAATGCEILGKAEFMNPGGSVKDRAALGIIRAAEQAGTLRRGGTVVEGTAGNTGIAIAHLCHARGYRALIVMPDNQSQEKYVALEALGVELRRVKAVPYADPNHYQRVAARLAAETPGAIWANQFDNTANRDAHEATTGPEIVRDAGAPLDAFVAATGTGGTLGGVARCLKARSPATRIVLADPQGSALFHWIADGELRANGPGSITEGIGIGRVTANLADTPIDDAVSISDAAAVEMVYRLLYAEGLSLGSASGVNVAAAVEIARRLGPGHRIATILCDGGQKYQSRLYSRGWLEAKGLLGAADAGRDWARSDRDA